MKGDLEMKNITVLGFLECSAIAGVNLALIGGLLYFAPYMINFAQSLALVGIYFFVASSFNYEFLKPDEKTQLST